MLKSLYIRNYILIDELEIDFNQGFTTITGETGAGKSIILGALSLVLGNRADTSAFKHSDKKCIIEAAFEINSDIKPLFDELELDFENVTILRREIHSNGKSRFFINDSPANLNQLKQIGSQLIDIHSQHDNIYLKDNSFLLELLDQYSNNYELLKAYKSHYSSYNSLIKKLDELKEKEDSVKSEFDFLSYQYKELEDAKLDDINELVILEEELNVLENSESIIASLSEVFDTLDNDENGTLLQTSNILSVLSKLPVSYHAITELKNRIESISLELSDIRMEVNSKLEAIESNPEKLEQLQDRYNILNTLLSKNNCSNLEELIHLKSRFEEKLSTIQFFDENLKSIEKEIEKESGELQKLASQISRNRHFNAKVFIKNITTTLSFLGMESVKFDTSISNLNSFSSTGTDEVKFLFTANTNLPLQELSKIASGGEISRFMLAMKAVLAERVNLPAIIFDEIDSGVSGEIADKMAIIMHKISQTMQVISITHLPQIACKGDNQFIVIKENKNGSSYTTLKKLTSDERVKEIARLISGSEITDSAIQTAKELLKS